MRLFWSFVALGLVAIAGLILYRDEIQTHTRIHEPDSPLGRKIDSALGLDAIHELEKARYGSARMELSRLRDQVSLFFAEEGRTPATLRELHDHNLLPETLARDPWNQPYRMVYHTPERELWLLSSGYDQVLFTDDDERILLPY